MSTDPYIDAKREVEANVRNLNDLLESYDRIQSTSGNSTGLSETVQELQNTIQALEADLEDLDECVRVVEGHGDRWGIDDVEVGNRRSFVNNVSSKIQRLRMKVQETAKLSRNQRAGPPTRYRDEEEGAPDGHEEERWEQEEQQTLMRRQESTLGVISGTLSTLASQAGLIGSEVNEQSEMLDDLSTRVDGTQSKLSRVSKQLSGFIRRNESSRSSWCIAILIVVLIVLLIAVILV